MPEVGIPYVLTGPDGTRAVFNDITDHDFVGYLDAEQGITGLLDTADVRESNVPRTEGHGTFQGNNWLSRKTGTFNGILYPNVGDMSVVNLYESKIKRASRGLQAVGPSTLTWTPTGGVQRLLWLWRQGRVSITGRRPKKFQIPMATADPYSYSAALQSMVINPNTASGADQGFLNPMTDPITTRYHQQSSSLITNQGDAETWPLFVIQGPVTNPTLLNNTTGLSWTLTYTLGSSDLMYVDSRRRTVLLGGTSNRYSAYSANLPANQWWPLVPGSNDVRFLAAQISTGAQVTVQWRHAWE